MLGPILGGLTNAAAAEDVLGTLADEALLMRVRSAADEHAVTPGIYIAATVRHLLDHGGEDIWLDLVGKIANSPQPGAVALRAILARAFPASGAPSCCGHEGHGQPRPAQARGNMGDGHDPGGR